MQQLFRRAALTALSAMIFLQAGCGYLQTQPQVANDQTQPPETVIMEGGATTSGQTGAGAQSEEAVQPGEGAQPEAGLPILTQAPAVGADTLQVLFINVGKADAILVQYGGANVLIDTGTEEAAPHLLGALAFMGVEKLDAVALTHTHKDHIGGFVPLAKQLPVEKAYAAVYSENKKKGGNKITEAAEEGDVPLIRLMAGETLPLGSGMDFVVLGPLVFNTQDDNDNSLILSLHCNNRKLLFTGDMQFAQEETLLSAGVDVSADVLKVGNHGNPDATGTDFGRAVSPSIAVISTDTNEDEDSANPRVYAALPGADVRVTQDTVVGVLLTIAPDGAMALYNAAPERVSVDIAMEAADRNTQTLTIHNDGDALDVSGWMIQSQQGGQLFVFPAGSVLPEKDAVTLAAQGGAGDFIFTGEKEPWHKKKADTAILYDRFGLEVARNY